MNPAVSVAETFTDKGIRMSNIREASLSNVLDAVSSSTRKKTDTAAADWNAALVAAFAGLGATAQNTTTAAAGSSTAVSAAGAAGAVPSATTGKSTSESFLEYMAMSPREKVMARMLAQLGISKEEYEAMPPEEKAKVAAKIEELMKKQAELQGGGDDAASTEEAAAKLNASMISKYNDGEKLWLNLQA